MRNNESYIIGINHNGEIWYYVGFAAHDGSKLAPANRYSSILDDAKEYDSYINAKHVADCDIPQEYVKWIIQIRKCPLCGKKYIGHPALSRKDNKTEICSDCGIREAIDAAIKDRLEKQTK